MPAPLPALRRSCRRRSLAALGAAQFLALSAFSPRASAHGLDAGRTTLEREGLAVRIVATPRAASLAAFDDDHDGLLSRDEVRAHRPEIRAAVDAALRLTDQAGNAASCEPTDVSTPGSGDPSVALPKSDHVRITRLCRFDHEPGALVVQDAGAAFGLVLVEALEVSAPVDGQRSILRGVESGVLAGPDRTVTLLGAAPAISAAPQPKTATPGHRPFSPWLALPLVALGLVPRLLARRSLARRRRRLPRPPPPSPRSLP